MSRTYFCDEILPTSSASLNNHNWLFIIIYIMGGVGCKKVGRALERAAVAVMRGTSERPGLVAPPQGSGKPRSRGFLLCAWMGAAFLRPTAGPAFDFTLFDGSESVASAACRCSDRRERQAAVAGSSAWWLVVL